MIGRLISLKFQKILPAKDSSVCVLIFSSFSAYMLSFLFEGQVMYAVFEPLSAKKEYLSISAMIALLLGIIFSAWSLKSQAAAKRTFISPALFSLLASFSFFFTYSYLWDISLISSSFACGMAVASFGYFLKAIEDKHKRIICCADILIYSNILMVLANIAGEHIAPLAGLSLSVTFLALSVILSFSLNEGEDKSEVHFLSNRRSKNLGKLIALLSFFVLILTVDAGLMYKVFNPAFEHLSWLTSWYWDIPYIVFILIIRNMSQETKKFGFLYLGMAMIASSFIVFMYAGRGAASYVAVDTLMLGALGIFDIFWWSVTAEMLDYTGRPAKTFGVIMASNVAGVLAGGLVGKLAACMSLSDSTVTVIAISVVCVTLLILPFLNRTMSLVLKDNSYLLAETAKQDANFTFSFRETVPKPLEPLTKKEESILLLLVEGKTNKEISEQLEITENTIRTHARNIYIKYAVANRRDLLALFLGSRRDDNNTQ